jgi:hypothetical protein
MQARSSNAPLIRPFLAIPCINLLPGPTAAGPGAVLIGSLSRRSLDLRYVIIKLGFLWPAQIK